jgi:ribonuclease-3 family protein
MEEDLILSNNVLTEDEIIRNYSGQALAYIGDSIFDLLIKDFFVRKTSMQTEKYHKVVTGIVKAVNQAALIDELIEENLLTDIEVDVYKRGRNSSVHTKAKNATMGEYKKATGFEAVLGYNYMKGERERLDFFVERALNKAGYL